MFLPDIPNVIVIVIDIRRILNNGQKERIPDALLVHHHISLFYNEQR
jgi:hypothetical protein